MLVSAAKMLTAAASHAFAVGQFNLNNLEWTKAIINAASSIDAPVILGATESACNYMGGVRTVRDMVGSLIDEIKPPIPIALHLDHASEAMCFQAIGAGFTSIMFDGSKMPFQENLRICKNLADVCRQKGISLEAELGSPAGEEDGINGTGQNASLAECKNLASSGITMLAPAIGNFHGEYPPDWHGLNMKLLEEIHGALPDFPLVLHGGTGIPEGQIKTAISLGITKINVNTECQIAFCSALRKYFAQDCDRREKGYNPQKIFKPAMSAIEEKVVEKIIFFGSEGKAQLCL